jgi:hypothetical protein
MLHDMAADAPGWIARLDSWLAGRISTGYVGCLVAIELLIVVWTFIPGWARTMSVAAGILHSLAAWVVVQGLGDLTTGQATDPNTGPLLVLLGVATYAAGRSQPFRPGQRGIRHAAACATFHHAETRARRPSAEPPATVLGQLIAHREGW